LLEKQILGVTGKQFAINLYKPQVFLIRLSLMRAALEIQTEIYEC